ncbi:hypothetical protein RUM43_000058 [Polyplax serrata]|uniref:Polycystin domain-containing protein n=1 Tax=Polyplax serrata TaxID=468196 RepID=A0AAN8XNE0_POLSC
MYQCLRTPTYFLRLLQYLNKTFLPALMVTKESHYQLWQADVVNKKRNTPSKDGRRTEGALKTFDLKFYEKGWTLEPAIKLIGPPRIRQLRVSTGYLSKVVDHSLPMQRVQVPNSFVDSCEQSLKLLGRNLLCAQELTWFNEEKRNFKIAWDASHGTGVTPWQASPWQYQTARKSGTLPMVAKFFIYPGGGYVLNLANSLNDSLLLLHYMDSFQWIDIQTRVVVGCVFFHAVENGSFVNEFRLGSYIKSLLTKESTDLFKSKGEKVDALLKELNASTLRLRGGGNQKSKLLSNDEYEMKKMGTQKKKSKNKLFYQEDTNILNRYVSELKSEWNYESCSRMKSEGFVKKKLHDLTEYRSISTDRMTLMKALATAELGRAEENKLSARKTALILLFLHLTSWDKTNKIRKMNKRNKSSLEYVREHGNEQVVLARRIHDMERVVGDFVRTKSAQAATKDNNSIDVFGLLNKLFMLNENIEFLLRNKK